MKSEHVSFQTALEDVVTCLDKSSAELLSDDMREAGGTIDYGMKTDYYQVAIYLPDLETLYNYFPDTYEKLFGTSKIYLKRISRI